MSETRKNNLVIQAGILATAGIVVRIIGLLYNTPLVHIIKDEGFGYYDSAYAAYSIVLLISSYSIPSAVSKVMAERLARKEYKNAYRVFVCSLIYVTVVGIIASLFVFFGAGILVKLESAILPLKILAPTIFFSGILGVFRGFFQAQNTMVPTSVSQVIEQVFNAGFSVLMAYILVKAATGKGATYVASMGAAGSTIGTGMGVLSALIFILIIYFYNRDNVKRRVDSDNTGSVMSYGMIFLTILQVVTPFIISTGVYNLNNFLDKTVYQVVMLRYHQVGESLIAFDLSAMAKGTKIANIPIAMASAMATTLIPKLSFHAASNDSDNIRETIAKATRVTMYISIPAAMGIGVLSKAIMRLIFPQPESLDLSSHMLIILAITVMLYGLSTITQAVLQSVGKMSTPIINAAISIVIHVAIMVIAMRIVPSEYCIYVYAGVTIIYSLCLCILNGLSVKKYLGYVQETDKTFIRPLICAIVMGLLTGSIYYVLYLTVKINIIALVVALFTGVFSYFVLSIKWQVLGEDELLTLPKGKTLLKIAKKLRLIK
ncbi:MAG: polysaccharide biosynthesis protein [Lachnospiraceae bacterium]|nr:polysaccharide biosynthesis protein [Lachnospiraceae bacterium]